MARLRELLAAGPQMAGELADKLFDPEDTTADRRRFLDALVTAGSRITGPDGLPCCRPATTSSSGPPKAPTRACRDRPARHARPARALPGVPGCLIRIRCLQAMRLSLPVRNDSAVTAECSTFGPQLPGEARAPGFFSTRAPTSPTRTTRPSREAPSKLDSKDAVLCASCGGHLRRLAHNLRPRRLWRARLLPVRKLNTPKDTITGCLVCGGRGAAMVRGFESGGDAAASVLSTSLYQALPPAPDPEQADQPGEGRKLLLFSDSRQAAAFFAPYLETSLRDHPAPPAHP